MNHSQAVGLRTHQETSFYLSICLISSIVLLTQGISMAVSGSDLFFFFFQSTVFLRERHNVDPQRQFEIFLWIERDKNDPKTIQILTYYIPSSTLTVGHEVVTQCACLLDFLQNLEKSQAECLTNKSIQGQKFAGEYKEKRNGAKSCVFTQELLSFV